MDQRNLFLVVLAIARVLLLWAALGLIWALFLLVLLPPSSDNPGAIFFAIIFTRFLVPAGVIGGLIILRVSVSPLLVNRRVTIYFNIVLILIGLLLFYLTDRFVDPF